MDDRKRRETGREAVDAHDTAGVQILTGEPNQQPTPRVRLVGCARTHNTTEPTTPTGAQRLRSLCSHHLTRCFIIKIVLYAFACIWYRSAWSNQLPFEPTLVILADAFRN